MVVVPEPAVKCCCAFGAVAVDGAVGPAGEHGADEALGFAVGLRSVGPRAQVAQTEGAAGDGVQLGAITRAVVGHHALDGDAVVAVEGDGAAQESSDGGGLLVGKYFGVGQARGVVDGDVDVVPTGRLAAASVTANWWWRRGAGWRFPAPPLMGPGVLEAKWGSVPGRSRA